LTRAQCLLGQVAVGVIAVAGLVDSSTSGVLDDVKGQTAQGVVLVVMSGTTGAVSDVAQLASVVVSECLLDSRQWLADGGQLTPELHPKLALPEASVRLTSCPSPVIAEAGAAAHAGGRD